MLLVSTSEQFCYEFSPENYEPQPPFYSGHYRFAKHFFPEIENLTAQGEEFDCAQIIDTLPEIKYWIRNPDLGKRGFWLPLSGIRGKGIRCNAVCPGPTPTPLNTPEKLATFDEFAEQCAKHMNMGLPHTPAIQQAQAILFFASDESDGTKGKYW